MVRVGRMLDSIGHKAALFPYNNASVRISMKSQWGDIVDAVNLQCYDGGAYNNAGTWNTYFCGLNITPLCWTKHGDGTGDNYRTARTRVMKRKNSYGIIPAGDWQYPDMRDYNGGTAAQFNTAIRNGLMQWPDKASGTMCLCSAAKRKENIMEEKIVYFESAGTDNTAAVIRLVKEQAAAKDVKKVVLASTRGGTAMTFAGAFQGTGLQLVVVPWQYGFGDRHGMGAQPFPHQLIEELREKGHLVHFGTMLFHTEDLYGNNAPRTIANTLRIFGQGIKVCVEIIMMAADGGHLTRGERVIAVAGTGNGADTAVIASAAPSLKFASLRIHEILCKPL